MAPFTNKSDRLYYISLVYDTFLTVFCNQIWSYRCKMVDLFEQDIGITLIQKRARTSGIRSHDSRSSASPNTNSPSLPSDDWKHWIGLALTTGDSWMGFLQYVNSFKVAVSIYFSFIILFQLEFKAVTSHWLRLSWKGQDLQTLQFSFSLLCRFYLINVSNITACIFIIWRQYTLEAMIFLYHLSIFIHFFA